MDRNRIEENFLTAMQTIAKAEVAAVKYDQTITCTIVDDNLRESGQYIVTDGTTRFTAYSSITSLRNNTVVYVTVPNGDFTQQKVIIGKQMSGEDKAFLYIAPFDNFIPCTPNLLTEAEATNKGQGYKLFANGDMIKYNDFDELLDWNPNKDKFILNETSQIISEKTNLVNYYKDFSRLGIRANFISWLKDYQIQNGNYGLRLILSYQDGELQDPTKLNEINPTSENKNKYLRTENGFDINREYYLKDTVYTKIDLSKDKYKPNTYYYKHYILDQSKTLRVKKIDNDGSYIYFTYYEKKEILDDHGYKKVLYNKIETLTEDNYEPNKYYYIPEEITEIEDDLYKLSEENGFIPECKYFQIADGKFIPLDSLTSEQYKENSYYGVLPIQLIKEKIMELDVETMLGSPYAFDSQYQQEVVFDISGIGLIIGLKLEFFESGDFTTSQKEYQYSNKNYSSEIINLFDSHKCYAGYENLIVNNIEIYMGITAEALKENEGYLKLFCYETDKYRSTSNPLLNMKNIYLKWAYKHEDGEVYIADKDNIGTFVEKLKQEVLDFPENGELQEQLNYFERMILDNSSVQIDERKYYERFISNTAPSASGALGNKYIKAFYNFIPNQGNDYNRGRDYFIKGIFPISEEKTSTILSKKYMKKTIKYTKDGEEVKIGVQYLLELSPGEYLSQSLPIGSLIDNSVAKWAKYDYDDAIKEEATHVSGYKKVSVNENTPKEILYNYYYANYQVSDLIDSTKPEWPEEQENDIVYIYYLEAINGTFTYSPNTFYYYNADNDLFNIKWYRYTQGAPAADEFCGIYWEEIPNLPKLIEGAQNDEETIQEIYDKYAKVTHLINDFQCELHPDYIYRAKEQIKAIIFMGDKVFYSEPIEFINESPTIDLPTLEVETALAPKFDDNSLGNYYLYGENNSLIDMGDAQTQRSISLLFDAAGGASETRSLLKNADKVTWIFPLKNTMIVPSLSLTPGVYVTKDGMGYIEDTENREEYKFYYTINKYYSYSDADNSIVCNVIKDGILYSTTANMSFGQSGSNGTEYTLTLDLMTADNMITVNPLQNLYYEGLILWTEKYGKDIIPYKITNEKYYLLEEIDNNKTFTQINIDDYNWSTDGLVNNLYVISMFLDNQNKENNNRLNYPCLNNYLYKYDDAITYIKPNNFDEKKQYFKFNEDTKQYEASGDEINETNYLNYYIKQEGAYSKVNIHSNPVNEEIKIVASLYDQTHKRMDIENYNISWSFPPGNIGNTRFKISKIQGKKSEIILQLKENQSINLENDMYIITAKLTGLLPTSGEITGATELSLETSLPLPLRKDFGPVRYQGPSEIAHNSLGVPMFYKDQINLYYNNQKGEFEKYPFDAFNIYPDKLSTNGLGPQLKTIQSNIISDTIDTYTYITEKKEGIEEYCLNPTVEDFQAVQYQGENKAWKGYWKKSLIADFEKIKETYSLITDSETIEKDVSNIYNLSNVYDITSNLTNIGYIKPNSFDKEKQYFDFNEDTQQYFEISSDEINETNYLNYYIKNDVIIYQNGLYYTFNHENKQFNLLISSEDKNVNKINFFKETTQDSFYANLIPEEKYKLIIKDDFIEIKFINNNIDRQNLGLQLYKLQDTINYVNATAYDDKLSYYIPKTYIIAKENENINNLYEKELYYEYVQFQENENNKTYYTPVGYKIFSDQEQQIGDKKFTICFEKIEDKTKYLFEENKFYSQEINDDNVTIYILIKNKDKFEDKNTKVYIKKYNIYSEDIKIYYKEDMINNQYIETNEECLYVPSDLQIIENPSLKEYLFIQNIKYKKVSSDAILDPSIVYYVPSEFEEVSELEESNLDEYYIKSIKTEYKKVEDNEELQTNITYYYHDQYFTQINDNDNLSSQICYIHLPQIKKVVADNSIAKIDIENKSNNWKIFNFENAEKLNSFDPNHFCFINEVTIFKNKIGSINKSESGCFLQTPSIYINGLAQFAIQLKYNGEIIFSIPILYYLNKYFSSTINKWDGELSIDNKKNTILAKMIGAGRKDRNNLFTGVIMGDWSGNNNSNFETGIYGFHNGETSFGFTENGQGFIGKAGHGRIVFDGDNAQLRSANYENGPFTTNNSLLYSQNGMLIDLDDAFLLTTNEKGKYIKINGLATAENKGSPVGKPLPGKNNNGHTDYPFVVYGGKDLYTEIGWNGDLRLKGSAGSAGNGQISLDASGEIPFEIKSNITSTDVNNKATKIGSRYVQIHWDASIVLSGNNWNNKILLDASAPNNASLLQQYKGTANWVDQELDRPFQVGQYLRATWDGYLEAQGAYFKDSNANSFNIHYNGTSATDINTDDRFFIGRNIAGKIGHITGSTGEETGRTNNVGITSEDNHGIKLNSKTNLSLTAKCNDKKTTTDKSENETTTNSTENSSVSENTTSYIAGIWDYFIDSALKERLSYTVQTTSITDENGNIITIEGETIGGIFYSKGTIIDTFYNGDTFTYVTDVNKIEVVYYQKPNSSNTTVENGDISDRPSSTGGIYIEAEKQFSLNAGSKIGTASGLFADSENILFLKTNTFQISRRNGDSISYNIMDLTSENTILENLTFNHLNNTFFHTNYLAIKDASSESKTYFDISKENNGKINMYAKNINLTQTNCAFVSAGYGVFNGFLSPKSIGLSVAYNTKLYGNTGIGIDPQSSYKLYVQGATYLNGTLGVSGKSILSGTASISGGNIKDGNSSQYSLQVTNGTKTDNLTATGTVQLGDNVTDNITLTGATTISGNSLTCTVDKGNQSGIYARFA